MTIKVIKEDVKLIKKLQAGMECSVNVFTKVGGQRMASISFKEKHIENFEEIVYGQR